MFSVLVWKFNAIVSAIFAAYKPVRLVQDLLLLSFFFSSNFVGCGSYTGALCCPEYRVHRDKGREQVEIQTILLATKNKEKIRANSCRTIGSATE